MSRFINETPLPEKLPIESNLPANARSPRIDEALPDKSGSRPSSQDAENSFLMTLLRALSAANS